MVAKEVELVEPNEAKSDDSFSKEEKTEQKEVQVEQDEEEKRLLDQSEKKEILPEVLEPEVEISKKEVFYEDSESEDLKEEGEPSPEADPEVLNSETKEDFKSPDGFIRLISKLSQSDCQNDEKIESIKTQIVRLDIKIDQFSKQIQKIGAIENQQKTSFDHISKIASSITGIQADLAEQVPQLIESKIKKQMGSEAIKDVIDEQIIVIKDQFES